MKANVRYYILILLSIISLNFVSCQKKDTNLPKFQPLELVKTESNISSRGGDVKIAYHGDLEKVVADTTWLKYEIKSGEVLVKVEPNPTSEGRNTTITLYGKDGSVKVIPVSQLGLINIISVSDYQFPPEGGDVVFECNIQSPLVIENCPDWLSYKHENNTLTFTAPANEGDDKLEASVIVKCGDLYQKQIAMSQDHIIKSLPLTYDELDGDYVLKAKNNIGEEFTVDVKLTKSNNDSTYTLSGDNWGIPISVKLKNNTLSISCQTFMMNSAMHFLMGVTVVGKDLLGNGFDDKYALEARTFKQPYEFTFVSNGTEFVKDGKKVLMNGFVVVYLDNGNIKVLDDPHAWFIDPVLTKKN